MSGTRGRRVFLVPHTHWDREWYEPEARFRQRLVDLLDHALQLLRSDMPPAPFLLDGQTVLLEDYLAVRPDQREAVRELAQSGRLLIGPWYILADELLPSGETLVRNLLLGRRDGASLGGWLQLGYSPDAFGHPSALPSILAGFGIAHAVLWRGYGGEPGQDGDLFRWVGPDGSAVLVYHLPPRGYEVGANLPVEHEALRRSWAQLWRVLEPRAADRPILVPCGADHHRLQADLLDVVARLREIAPEAQFEVASPTAYFAALGPAPAVPETRGELRHSYRYAWTLQGVASSRARLKQLVAEGEALLARWAEPQAALARIEGGSDRRRQLEFAWREHLKSCFHDSIAGTAVDEVAQDVAKRARAVTACARGILVDSLWDRLRQDPVAARRQPSRWAPALVVVNPSPCERSGIVEATVTVARERILVGPGTGRRSEGAAGWPAPPCIMTHDGTPVPAQVLDWHPAFTRLDSPCDYPLQHSVAAFRMALDVEAVPPLGLRSLRVVSGRPCAPPMDHVWVSGRRLAGHWCDVDPDPRGGFAVLDRLNERRFGQMAQLVSERDDGDLYTHQPVEGDQPLRAHWAPARIVWSGPLVAAAARDFRIGDRVRGTLFARLDAGSRLVRFVLQGENLAGQHRVRALFPVPQGTAPERTIADMHFGPEDRPLLELGRADFQAEWPVATAPMHRYVSVAGGPTVFARGLYEYELTSDGILAVTIFRSVGELSRRDLAARPGHVAWPAATPEAEERGWFRVELAVVTSGADSDSWAREGDGVELAAEEFHAPLAGLMLPHAIEPPESLSGPALQGGGLIFTALKPAEDGSALVLRCVNGRDEVVEGAWGLPWPAREAQRARLDESPIETLPLSEDGRLVEFRAAPREIVTVLVARA